METNDLKQAFIKAISKALFFIFLLSFACNAFGSRTITGLLTSATDGSALPGVNVTLKGTKTGTVSDIKGKYQISVSNKGAVLVFDFIGFQTKEVIVNQSDVINVALAEDIATLDEVVVVGYGVQKRNDLASAVSSISSVLMGRCAGVSVQNAEMKSYAPSYFNPSTESYSKINENGFKDVNGNPLSTFSIDVDKASYSNMRRFINQGTLPPADAVRIEELVNYFDYDYPQPKDEHPFSINTEYTNCPWQADHKLLRIGLQGKKIETENLPPSNLVFLLDVSGSMAEDNKLPLVKAAFKLLVNNLRENDHVAIVVYAGAAGVVLPTTNGNNKTKILEALNSLQAGGSTAGCEGIALAYKIAKENFIKKGNNRVILATDGDFNVGISNENELENFITEKRNDGIYLTCLGFGMGNYKDSKIETLSDKGNGNYAYIDDIIEANKVFVNEFGGTLFTIAKDVKIQIEFNPYVVKSYRLIGYENRLLNNEDFKDDTKDAGELGSGHTVTALYEIIPIGVNSKFAPIVDKLKYQAYAQPESGETTEVATVKFRYKKPDGETSIEMVHPISSKNITFDNATENTRFAASVAMFGMLLTNSEYKGSSNFNQMLEMARNAKGYDREGYRGEFVRLAKTANSLGLSASK